MRTTRAGAARLMRGLRAAASASAVLLSINACRQVLGVDGYGTKGDYPGQHDGVLYSSRSCRDCVDAHCGDPAIACAQEPACAEMAKCLAQCNGPNDHPCRGQCNLSIPRTPEFADVVACEAKESCGDCAASVVVRGNGACDECLAILCPDSADALSRSPAALHRDICKKDCTEGSAAPSADGGVPAPDCSCDPSGDITSLDAVNRCVTGPCNDKCNPAVDWSCLGHVQWPRPAPALGKLELHLSVVDATNFSSPLLPSFQVMACSPLDLPCNAPLTKATGTDSRAILSINAQSFGGFFDHLLVTSTDPDPVGALLYFYPPVRRSPAWSARRIVTKAFAQSTLVPLGIVPDWATKGGIVWSVTSCLGPLAFAEGVTVSATPDAPGSASDVPVYYFVGSGLSLAPPTSTLGVGAIINIDGGAWTLKASTIVNGKTVSIGSYPVGVVTGKITHVTMAPAPGSGG
jgi:hypothetical protein